MASIKESLNIVGIERDITTLLQERNYCTTDYAISRIVDTWARRKADLIKLFRKSPNWDEDNLLITCKESFERKSELSYLWVFSCYLRRELLALDKYDGEASQVIDFIESIPAQFFNRDMDNDIARLNKINDKFKLRNNMKSSKAIGKLCRELGWDKIIPDFNAEYAKCCDALNPLKVERNMCLSLNPIDFLLMSNGNSWHSCHDIGWSPSDAGCYSAGTVSYMLDGVTFLFYTIDKSYEGNDYSHQEKITREVFCYKNGTLLQSRLYPQSMDVGADNTYSNIRAIVQKIISDLEGEPNLWVKKGREEIDDYISSGDDSCNYPDWEEGNPGSTHCVLSVMKDKELEYLEIGAVPICVQCGEEHNNNECIDCEGDDCYYCTECGDRIDEDDVIWVEGDPYCYDCVVCCDYCDEYTTSENSYTVYSSNGEIQACEYCMQNRAFCCDECGDLWDLDDVCYDEETDCNYCPNCYQDLLESRKDDGSDE